MLDLKQLEESLDNALAKETYESVNAWLLENEMQKIQSFIGIQGYFSHLEIIRNMKVVSETQKYLKQDLEAFPPSQLFLAA